MALDYAKELSEQLKAHAATMESAYTDLFTATNRDSIDDKEIKRLMRGIDDKTAWFEKAEAGSSFVKQGCK